jgi:hypothetical protein
VSQPDTHDGSRPLKNGKDEAFCRESIALDSIHKGYEAAGFKRARGNADRKARQPNVAKRLEFLGMEAAKLAGVSLARVLIEQARLAYSNMDDFVEISEAGLPVLNLAPLKALPDHERRALLAAVKTVKYTDNGPTFELHDKPGALRDLKKHVGGDAPSKVALTDAEGNPAAVVVNIMRFTDGSTSHPPKQLAPA